MQVCSIDGCSKKIVARSWCHMHYKRWQKHKDPLHIQTPIKKKPKVETLLDKYDANEEIKNECWEWKGKISASGYGCLDYKGKSTSIHRVSYQYFKGIIPNKMNVCHSCDNKKCFNPLHLWLGTTKENIDDAYRKGLINTRKGSKNHHSKLKEYQILEIRVLINAGMKNIEIAEKYDVGHGTISLIRLNQTWKHVKG